MEKLIIPVLLMLLETDMSRLPARYLNLNLLITEIQNRNGVQEPRWMNGFLKERLETISS